MKRRLRATPPSAGRPRALPSEEVQRLLSDGRPRTFEEIGEHLARKGLALPPARLSNLLIGLPGTLHETRSGFSIWCMPETPPERRARADCGRRVRASPSENAPEKAT